MNGSLKKRGALLGCGIMSCNPGKRALCEIAACHIGDSKSPVSFKAGTKLKAFGFRLVRMGQFSVIDVAWLRDIGARQHTGRPGQLEAL